MKKKHITYHIYLMILLLASLSSCSDKNNNPDIDDYEYITLLPSIGQERVFGNSFETNDAIGVFVVPFLEDNTTPGAIDQSEYAPNTEFIFNGNTWNTASGNRIHWPDATRQIELYAYYPYDSNLSTANARDYAFTVNEDQQTKVGYENSDFLWVKSPAVSPTRNPIDLVFSHILSKIRINVKSELDEIVELIPRASVTIINTKHSAAIDLANGNVTIDNLSEGEGILSFSHASPATDYLLSTEAILIPQTAGAGIPLLRIEIPGYGVRYTYSPTEDILFEKGKERTFNITITQFGISVSVGEITDWQESEIIEGEIGKPIPKVLDLRTIDWNSSLVQYIYDNGVQIGQITREYLFKTGTVDAQAIVIYAMGDDGQIDQTTGFVAQVMNRTRNAITNIYEPNTANIHGGTVTWATGNMMNTYTVGNRPLFNKVEISGTGIIPVADTAINSLNIRPYRLTDIDGNNYSIVKISSQYWMAENLKTENYRDGSDLIYSYYNNDIANKTIYGALYTWGAAVDSRNIAPEGWSVPVNDMFISVYRYLTPDAGRKLKANILWSNLNYNDNVTGFNGLPGGRKTDTGEFNQMYNYGQWWSATSTSTTNAYRLYLDYGNNAMHNADLSKNYTQSIRLIRD